jgi:hypothetical protein
MGCCFSVKDKLLKYQSTRLKKEYKNKFINIYDIGYNTPYPVYHDVSLEKMVETDTDLTDVYNMHKSKMIDKSNIDIIPGLCSLYEAPIHISIGHMPNRLILSSVLQCGADNKFKKGECFYIRKIEMEEIQDTSQITQYHIYDAIQNYYVDNPQICSDMKKKKTKKIEKQLKPSGLNNETDMKNINTNPQQFTTEPSITFATNSNRVGI